MKNKGIRRLIFLTALLFTAFTAWSAEIDISTLIRAVLENNSDLAASAYDVSSEKLNYESLKSGTIPSLGFTTDTGNNPLYRFSDANEFSTDTFSTARYSSHRFGGGLNFDAALPTGGSLSLTGAGNLDLSIADTDSAEWQYQINPAVSLYLRQPLFIDRLNGSPMRLDSLDLADELASISVRQAEISRTALENNLIILLTRTSAVLNSLNSSDLILNSRIELAQKRLELALRDEEAGRLSSLDRLLEELQIRKLQEAKIDLAYQIDAAVRDLQQLTGGEFQLNSNISLSSLRLPSALNASPEASLGVLNAEAVARSIELAGTAVQKGNEPVFEISALYRRSDSETAADLSDAFEAIGTAEMDLSMSVSLAFPLIDWGEMENEREAEKKNLLAAGKRLSSAMEAAILASETALNNLKLIEEKIILLQKGLEYDNTLLERELVRFEAGLSSEAAVETIELDLLEREFAIKQLQDEKVIAIFELYNSGGEALKSFFEQ